MSYLLEGCGGSACVLVLSVPPANDPVQCQDGGICGILVGSWIRDFGDFIYHFVYGFRWDEDFCRHAFMTHFPLYPESKVLKSIIEVSNFCLFQRKIQLEVLLEETVYFIAQYLSLDFRSITNYYESSRAGESHPHALTDPDMNVAAHPALIVQPPPDAASASAQRAPGHGGQSAGSSARSAGDAAAGVY